MHSTRPILVLGANGQVGQALCQLLGPMALGADRETLNLAYPDAIPAFLKTIQPSAIINAAAYTQVDKAQTDTQLAFLINAHAPLMLAQYAQQQDIPFIHYSTDYVFDGTNSKPYTETDLPAPLNVYGHSKLEGEKNIQYIGGRYVILRTSWVYASTGKNFVHTMLKLAQERTELSVVSDQYGSPTYAEHLAEITLSILPRLHHGTGQTGLFHTTAQGITSWYEFAERIFDLAQFHNLQLKINKLNAISTTDYPTPAQRPAFSALSNERLAHHYQLSLPHWHEAISQCMQKIANNYIHTM
jgi:dTDP-4-dehydrorhamnose reductase